MIQSFLFNCGLGSANFIFFFFFKNNSIYLFLAVLGRRCGEGFSPVAASEDDSLVAVLRLLSSQITGSRHVGFRGCGS